MISTAPWLVMKFQDDMSANPMNRLFLNHIYDIFFMDNILQLYNIYFNILYVLK